MLRVEFGETVEVVDAADWRATLAARQADGYAFFDLLTAVDDDAVFTVVACVCRGGEQLVLRTTVPRTDPVLDSVTPLYAGADWHERETAEMYGLTFAGHPNPVPLLLPDPHLHPLRKDADL